MIKGMFRAAGDQKLLGELKAFSPFRQYVDKLRHAHGQAMADIMYASPQDLQVKQGYLRALAELIKELDNPGA